MNQMPIPDIWTAKNYQEFLKYLKSLSELKYRNFQSKLTYTKYQMLGIRIPLLRRIAVKISKTDISSFFKQVKNIYYEEIMIEGFVIATIKDETTFDKYFYEHIKKIDDWSLCDSFCNSLKSLTENSSKYFHIAIELSLSEEEFISRVGLIIILSHFVQEEYLSDIFKTLDRIESSKYYINMAEAWLICELYIKYKEVTLNYLRKNNLNTFTQNKAISKIRDSYRATPEEKAYLNTLKRK